MAYQADGKLTLERDQTEVKQFTTGLSVQTVISIVPLHAKCDWL